MKREELGPDVELLTPEQAARKLNLVEEETDEGVKKALQYLANLRSSGDGPPFTKVGGKVRYPWSAVVTYLNENLTRIAS